MPPPRPQPRSQPRRLLHHRISLSFSTPDNAVPQLYEWVSSGFPFSVIVHHYSISTTHPPPSRHSSASPGTEPRLSHSPWSSAGSDPDPNDSLLAELDNGAGEEGHVNPSESILEELGRRLHRLAGAGEAEMNIVSGRDPWTTWFPPTPPLRSRDAAQAKAAHTPVILFSRSGVAPSVLLHVLGMHRSGMDAIEEHEMEVAENQYQQELTREQSGVSSARLHELCAGLPDDEADFAQLIDEKRSSPRGSCLCWVCRAILRRYARRHNLFP
ncbi:hypothetical protein PMIN06_012725 [Paraphaeosphaeria minitans]|uniref:Uncharacterized protein n=1 Tax=Paraphaeosphaeria minitans TaxID=565426 RepID=A0A9P6KV50_9PLEO|nr:hypothetical protein PMIN01_02310 [Paraphaeosphaeria minitans]